MSEDNKHFSVTRKGNEFVIAKYKPVFLDDGTVEAEKQVWVVPAILFQEWEIEGEIL